MASETITLPKKIFQDMIVGVENFEQIQDALEDYLFIHNKKFLDKIRKARINHRKRNFTDWSTMKKKYGV